MGKRGGRRDGSGRKKGEPTKVIAFRVKEAVSDQIKANVKDWIDDYHSNLVDGVYMAPTMEWAKGYIADCWDEQERYYTVTSSDIELLEKALENGLDAFNRQMIIHEKKYNQ